MREGFNFIFFQLGSQLPHYGMINSSPTDLILHWEVSNSYKAVRKLHAVQTPSCPGILSMCLLRLARPLGSLQGGSCVTAVSGILQKRGKLRSKGERGLEGSENGDLLLQD